jgi:phosphoribosylanthranilate isomerase
MKIKLCGFTEQKSVELACSLGCDFIGVVFVNKSVRYISPQDSQIISDSINNYKKTKKVAVVMNQSLEELSNINRYFSPHFFQLHGDEDHDFIIKIKHKFPNIGIIKAISVHNLDDIILAKSFSDLADFLLFDNKNAGSGEKFNWELLNGFESKKPWFLSGGINVNNLEEVLKNPAIKLIDVSSGIEENKGIKSLKLIAEIMKKINEVQKFNL